MLSFELVAWHCDDALCSFDKVSLEMEECIDKGNGREGQKGCLVSLKVGTRVGSHRLRMWDDIGDATALCGWALKDVGMGRVEK
jgi:hypothetical protein